MALQKDRGRLVVKGGGTFSIRELYPTATDSFSDLGYVKSTTLTDEHSLIEHVDERGLLVNYQSAAEKFMVTLSMMQSGVDLLQLLQNAGNKRYEGFYAVRLPDDGNWQEVSIPLMRIRPGYPGGIQRASGEQLLEVSCVALAVKQALTRTPTGFNISADKTYVIAENASALGAPTDTASTHHTNAW